MDKIQYWLNVKESGRHDDDDNNNNCALRVKQ
jgi:hypothetical protein